MGPDVIKSRGSSVLSSDRLHRRQFAQIVIRTTTFLLLLATTTNCFPRRSVAQTTSTHSEVYEVASIRPSAPSESQAGQTDLSGDRFVAKNLSVQQMIYMAYAITMDDYIANLPQWARSARFDVQIRLAEGKENETELVRTRVVLRALLADRFHLEAHYQTLDRRVYALVVDRHGAKLQEAASSDHFEMSVRRGDIHLRAANMLSFVQGIALTAGRPVIDKTGLVGRYNIDLKCAPDELADTSDAGVPLLTVLREQFGLRLEPIRSPVDVLFIDQLERPTVN